MRATLSGQPWTVLHTAWHRDPQEIFIAHGDASLLTGTSIIVVETWSVKTSILASTWAHTFILDRSAVSPECSIGCNNTHHTQHMYDPQQSDTSFLSPIRCCGSYRHRACGSPTGLTSPGRLGRWECLLLLSRSASLAASASAAWILSHLADLVPPWSSAYCHLRFLAKETSLTQAVGFSPFRPLESPSTRSRSFYGREIVREYVLALCLCQSSRKVEFWHGRSAPGVRPRST